MTSSRLIKAVKSYDWKCLECKMCEICMEKGDDVGSFPSPSLLRDGQQPNLFPFIQTRLLFCDKCDRGTHLDCLDPPLAKPPKGMYAPLLFLFLLLLLLLLPHPSKTNFSSVLSLRVLGLLQMPEGEAFRFQDHRLLQSSRLRLNQHLRHLHLPSRPGPKNGAQALLPALLHFRNLPSCNPQRRPTKQGQGPRLLDDWPVWAQALWQ